MSWGAGRAVGRWRGRSGPLEARLVCTSGAWPRRGKSACFVTRLCVMRACVGMEKGAVKHDDSPALLYTGVCSVGSVVSSFFFVKSPLTGARPVFTLRYSVGNAAALTPGARRG